jgi:arsenate reductase
VFSAGSAPASEIHPLARAALEDKYRIDTAALHPKSMSGFLSQRFDFAITVCDRTAENCPVFPGDPQRIHWSFEDPVTIPDLEARRRAFEQIANGLSGRLRIWMSLPEIQRRLRGESTPDHSRSHPADDAL